MIKEQLFLYECEFFKINRPSNELMERMFEGIGEIQEELGVDNLDNPKILHYVAKRVVLPLAEDYDIGAFSEEEFEKIYNHSDSYGEQISDMFYILRSLCLDIVLHYYKNINLKLKEQEILLATVDAKNKLVAINQENERIKKEVIETKKKQLEMPKMSRRERRKMERELAKQEKEIIKQHPEWTKEDIDVFLGKYKL